MTTGILNIDLDALARNWQALNAMTECETAAVIKADGYGLDSGRVATRLAQAGARNFFVAVAEEGVAVRKALGDGPTISVFSGHCDGDTALLRDYDLVPMLNSIDQVQRHVASLPGMRFGVQLDSGMNRLGMEPNEWAATRHVIERLNPTLIMSHLACADEPDHPMNSQQLSAFRDMTHDATAPRSLAATGGILLGKDYHFDLCRPGVGLYGGSPYDDAAPVVSLDLPVIQTRKVKAGETVGYANAWAAQTDSIIATVSGGYADGLIRAMGDKAVLWCSGISCPVVGRVSMDLITVDVTHLDAVPTELSILCSEQRVDDLAAAAGTIGYEILTSLGSRYERHYHQDVAAAEVA